MSEIPASVQNITPECRFNRGAFGALTEAWQRIEAAYADYVDVPDNEYVTWRLSLIRVEDD
jgi:hypothetical protein